MPSSQPSQTNSGVILERIDRLIQDVSDLKKSVQCLDDALTKFERDYEREHTRIVATVAHIETAVNQHESRLKELENIVKPLIWTNRFLAFIGTALVMLLIGMFWALLTNQIAIVPIVGP